MKVHQSALKHGVSGEDAVQAAGWSQWIEPRQDDEWPHREFRLGFDAQARLLETVVLIFDGGEELVIHATPARKQYWGSCPEPGGTVGVGSPVEDRLPLSFRRGLAVDLVEFHPE